MHASQRLHSLDAVRAFALLLGIVLHATMSFFLPFPAADSSQSASLGVTFYVIHLFRMSLFYVIAGFFAHMLLHRRGLRGFVRDRAKRILVPMTAGWVVLAPLTIVIVIWGLSRTFAGQPVAEPPAAAGGFPLTHLWFLYYLTIFYALALVVREGFVALVDRGGRLRRKLDRLVGGLIQSRIAPLVLALPAFAVLYRDPDWPVWFGIPTPDTGFVPQLPALVGFGAAFAFGWLLHRRADLLASIQRSCFVYLAAGIALTIYCLSIVGTAPDLAEPTRFAGGDSSRFVYAASYAVASWCWILGIVGAGLRFCENASPLRRYLADSSYWLYLAHLPVIFFLQVLLMDLPIHWAIKFPLILAIAMMVLLASYHYCVRPTFIGEILNGRRFPRGPVRDPAASSRSQAVNESASVAVLAGVSKRYGNTTALAGLDLELNPGELLAVLGPNGAGKSTAISLWLGLLTPDAGTVRLAGGSPFETGNRLAVGVMMQDVSMPSELTPREIVELTASYYPNPLSVDETFALTGTLPLADTRYKKLSAGQKRQVQFAAAVCGRPRILFLDEPTVGLDIEARERMWATIRGLVADGCAIVLTTHYLEEAESLADRVAVLARGKLIAAGSVAEMRSFVSRRQIRCASTLAVDEIRQWPGVIAIERDDALLRITAVDAEAIVRRLLTADAGLEQLEVRQASLADAFTELMKEAA
jgi:ABC-type multidrug transport system ATPase subunit/surface polysaccharide O-acyltransferase-like enzyme